MEFTVNVPNPKCCSVPGHLCPKCKAASPPNNRYLGAGASVQRNKKEPERLDPPKLGDMIKAAMEDSTYSGPTDHRTGKLEQSERLDLPTASDYEKDRR